MTYVGLIYTLILSFFIVVRFRFSTRLTLLAQVAFSEYQSFRTVDVWIGNASDDSFYHPPSLIVLFCYIFISLTILLTAQSSVPGRFFTQVSFLLDGLVDSLAEYYRRFGAAGFVLFWMLNWAGMLSVGLALEAMLTLMTMKGVPFFMILLIISALIPLSFLFVVIGADAFLHHRQCVCVLLTYRCITWYISIRLRLPVL